MIMNFESNTRYRKKLQTEPGIEIFDALAQLVIEEVIQSQHWPAGTDNVYSKVQTQNANLKLA